jgi:hypothetical protein
MLARRSAPAGYWEEVGRQALAQGVERIVIMGARESLICASRYVTDHIRLGDAR